MKKILFSLLIFGAVFGWPAIAWAGQYGEVEVSRGLAVDKKVKNPQSGQWVDNLFASEYKYAPEEEVEFKITVKNTGSKDWENVKLKDTLPQYLSRIAGDTEIVFSLKAGESKDFYLKAKAADYDQLPSDKGLYCLVNTAEASFDNQKDQDTAQICIEKKVLGFAALPEAGPTDNALILLGSTVFALAGLALIKKGTKKAL